MLLSTCLEIRYKDVDEYKTIMGNYGEFSTEFEASVLARIYGKNLIVYRQDKNQKEKNIKLVMNAKFNDEEKVFFIMFTGKDRSGHWVVLEKNTVDCVEVKVNAKEKCVENAATVTDEKNDSILKEKKKIKDFNNDGSSFDKQFKSTDLNFAEKKLSIMKKQENEKYDIEAKAQKETVKLEKTELFSAGKDDSVSKEVKEKKEISITKKEEHENITEVNVEEEQNEHAEVLSSSTDDSADEQSKSIGCTEVRFGERPFAIINEYKNPVNKTNTDAYLSDDDTQTGKTIEIKSEQKVRGVKETSINQYYLNGEKSEDDSDDSIDPDEKYQREVKAKELLKEKCQTKVKVEKRGIDIDVSSNVSADEKNKSSKSSEIVYGKEPLNIMDDNFQYDINSLDKESSDNDFRFHDINITKKQKLENVTEDDDEYNKVVSSSTDDSANDKTKCLKSSEIRFGKRLFAITNKYKNPVNKTNTDAYLSGDKTIAIKSEQTIRKVIETENNQNYVNGKKSKDDSDDSVDPDYMTFIKSFKKSEGKSSKKKYNTRIRKPAMKKNINANKTKNRSNDENQLKIDKDLNKKYDNATVKNTTDNIYDFNASDDSSDSVNLKRLKGKREKKFKVDIGRYQFPSSDLKNKTGKITTDRIRYVIEHLMASDDVRCTCTLSFYGSVRPNQNYEVVTYAKCKSAEYDQSFCFKIDHMDQPIAYLNITSTDDIKMVHKSKLHRYLKGEGRIETQILLRDRSVKKYQDEIIKNTSLDLVNDGYMQDIRKDSVIFKAKSEDNVKERLTLKSYDLLDAFQLYIQHQKLADPFLRNVGLPLTAIMFREAELNLVNKGKKFILHMDATGSIVRRPQDLNCKRIFYYAAVVKLDHDIVKLFDMITDTHTSAKISEMLLMYKDFAVETLKRK